MSFRRLFRRISRRESRKSRRTENISIPTGFEHRVHVTLDKESGKYIGLPSQWAAITNTKNLAKRSNSSPDLRQHYAAARKQNGATDRAYHDTDDMTLPGKHSKNNLENTQENTIERLRYELRDHKAKSTSDGVSANRYSWQDGPSSASRTNGNINSIERGNEKLEGYVSSPSPVSCSVVNRSESSV